MKSIFNFLDRAARQVYAERRFELEKALGVRNPGASVRKLDRFVFRDNAGNAFIYRMGAGFPGDVNRPTGLWIEPCLIDASAPPTLYGQGVVVDATTEGVRPIVAGDSALTDIYGVTVRPFPLQQNSVTPAQGTAVPPTSGIIDVLRSGYIVVQLGNGQLTGAVKGQYISGAAGAVYVWFAANSGNHVQGSFEASTSGSAFQLTAGQARSTFNGVQDASGFVELAFHV